jgi:BirA family biotin operon repressor/biotin-[acetyl-CoA-carboxylase] ligase
LIRLVVNPAPFFLSLTSVDVASSSSDLAWQAAADGAAAGAAFLVGEQTAGRGRRGAAWSSARGGMYLSILLRPSIPANALFGLSFVAALAICDELKALLPGQQVSLKWPNDVLAGGGKICGILLEVRGDAVVIGTGVNIAPVAPVSGARLPTTSVQALGGHDVTPVDLAESYGHNLLARVDDYAQAGFGPVRLEWLRHCAHIDHRMRVSTGAEVIAGLFVDLDADGALVLRDDAGHITRITTGDVELMGRG